ncbi:MAG: tRNA pseudouridine(38-40) synthase TruA [Bacteroidaceae bacterium]|nr:tRNA pseudouridine(38-40) synthase TruA [Bacteroidaceae bacterium]
MRFFLTLSYDGTNYSGWQTQPNAPTVQQTLEEALATLLRVPAPVVGAGRTDAGVHARMMVAHLDVDDVCVAAQPQPFTDWLCEKLNRLLPSDIAIHSVQRVRDDAHARFDALARTYIYYVHTAKSPFGRDYSMRLFTAPDFEAMNKAASRLFDYTDFTSFSKLHTDVKTNNCRIMQARWEQESEGVWTFTIQADRFLRNMVRAIVGTLLEVGRGRMTIEEFCRVIEQKDRCSAGTSVPGRGLFLTRIDYPQELFISNF